MMKRSASALAVAAMATLSGQAGTAQAQSLYDEATYSPLAADRRSVKAGDLITVLVAEQSSAVSSADTDADRRASVRAQATLPHRNSQAGVGVTSEFDGELVVEGDQQLTINDEVRTIMLPGRLRAIDVAENNTVPSSRLADARIVHNGDGVLASRQKPGLWQNLLGL